MLHKLPIEGAKLVLIGVRDRLAGIIIAAGFDAVNQGHRWRWVDANPVVAGLFRIAKGSADGEGSHS